MLDGVPIEETGLPPHFPFEGGSFANGGAMRISFLAIAYRKAEAAVLRKAVRLAILSSHRHPEAVDFAVVQARCVQYALSVSPDQFNPAALLLELEQCCEDEAMQEAVNRTAHALSTQQQSEKIDELDVVAQIVDAAKRPGSGMGFQIASVHMMPCVLWAVCQHHEQPRLAVQTAIDLGGDTDTTAAMVGAVMGALWGEEWCQDWAAGLENGDHGRDYGLSLAAQLVELNVCD